MTRAALPALALGALMIGGLIVWLAASLDAPAVTVARQTVIVTVTASITPTRTPKAPTATATMTPRPTPTELPDCQVTLYQNLVCAWPSKTAVLPLPVCATPDEGAACVRGGQVRVTMIGGS